MCGIDVDVHVDCPMSDNTSSITRSRVAPLDRGSSAGSVPCPVHQRHKHDPMSGAQVDCMGVYRIVLLPQTWVCSAWPSCRSTAHRCGQATPSSSKELHEGRDHHSAWHHTAPHRGARQWPI